MEMKIKHLEFIQNTILRMASNSFFLKGWTVTIIVGIFIFADSTNNDSRYLYIVLLPIICFWVLDGFYLYQEKLFRQLYNKVKNTNENLIDFSMDTSTVKSEVQTWRNTVISKTLNIFYLPLLVLVIIAILFAYS